MNLTGKMSGSLSARRAWIEIAASGCAPSANGAGSLSARRAWIEMPVVLSVSLAACVALRKESVDRNVMLFFAISGAQKSSLSARRAWIAWNVSLSDCSGRFCSCGYPL